MKYIIRVSFSVICLLMISCENEPVDHNIKPPEEVKQDVGGTYLLTKYNTSFATDLDSDGVSSVNQMEETTCFSDNYLTINEDNTFSGVQNGIGIVFDGSAYSLDCSYKPDLYGTWELNGGTLNLFYSQNGASQSMQFSVSGSKLIRRINDNVVTKNGSGEPISVSANIEMVFVR